MHRPEVDRKNLLLVSHSREVGGAEVYLENVVRHIARGEAWQPTLICRRDSDIDDWAESVARYCPVARLDVGRPNDVVRMARRMRAASLVQLNLSYPTGKYPFTVALLAASLGRPLVVTHHLALRVGAPWHQLMVWLGRAAARHIAVSHHSAGVLLLDYGYPRERLEVIHNGIDADLFHPATPDDRSRTRRAMGEMLEGKPWAEDMHVACTVARLSTQKGLFDLIDAADRLRALENLRIVVIGEGGLRRILEQKIRETNLANRLFIAGSIPRRKVAEWMAASDLFILPSRYEGGPATALMEAMACGCAVIATDVSGTNELVTDQRFGRLVPAQSPPTLAEAIREVLADPAERSAMASRGRQKVMTDFTIEVSMRKTEQVFGAALGSSRSSRTAPTRTSG